MADPTHPNYERLPGKGNRQLVPTWGILLLFFVIGIFALLLRGRRAQLWRGDDHLLVVETDFSREYYKRFRFADIQALTVERTADGLVNTVCLGLFCLLFLGIAIAVPNSVAQGILLVVSGLFGIALALNAAAGPTCRCYVRTAVQVEQLAALARLRHAQQALDRIRPLMIAVQGELPPDWSTWRSPDITRSAGYSMAADALEDPDVPPRIVV